MIEQEQVLFNVSKVSSRKERDDDVIKEGPNDLHQVEADDVKFEDGQDSDKGLSDI